MIWINFAKVKFLLEKPAWDSMRAASKAGTTFELPKANGKHKTGALPMFYAPDEFKPHTSTGRKIIQKFVMAMKSDFESIHHKLVDANGEANFSQFCFLIQGEFLIPFEPIWFFSSSSICKLCLVAPPHYARGMGQSYSKREDDCECCMGLTVSTAFWVLPR